MPSRPQTLAIIVPCFNERATLEAAVTRLLEEPAPHGLERTVWIIDDGSTDGSTDLANTLAEHHADVMVHHHDTNRGKGSAVRSGLARADADIVLIHDADLEYHPRDHESVLAPFMDRESPADVVIGSRFRGGGAHRVLYFWHELANRAITLVCDMVANVNLSDIECCTKAFSREMVAQLTPSLEEDGFGIEPELVIRSAQARLTNADGSTRPPRIFEVPVSYAGRTYAEGKKIRWTDGVEALGVVARCGTSAPAR